MRRKPVPVQLINSVDLPGIEGARAWGDTFSQAFQDDLIESIHQEREYDFPANEDGTITYDILALSGGGSHGAFGAGYIYGWTKSGKRPMFKIVTGISTGALIAAFAYFGPEYNEQLKEMFTEIKTRDIFKVRKNLLSWLWRDSFAKTKPLEKRISNCLDDVAIKAFARAHLKGRRLYIGTTNMDAQRLTVWNIGKIAASGHPNAKKIIHKVFLAAASIPVAFPPVFFDVELDGKYYDEMHVDGGTITDVFFCGYMLDLVDARRRLSEQKGLKPLVNAYIIRSGKLTPSPDPTTRNIRNITRRTIMTVYKAHGWDHLHHIYNTLKQNGFEFNYAGIPSDYYLPEKQGFEKKEMQRLFNYGVKMSNREDNWQKMPYGYDNHVPEEYKHGS